MQMATMVTKQLQVNAMHLQKFNNTSTSTFNIYCSCSKRA